MNSTNVKSNQTQNVTRMSTVEMKEKIITQKSAHISRSSQYSVVTTEDVLKMFEAEGFTWNLVSYEKSRKETYKGYGTHLIALDSPELTFEDPTLNIEVTPRIYLKNSYHGRTSFVLDLGLFRTYCRNGLILGTRFKSVQLRHIRLTQSDIKKTVEIIKKEYNERVMPLLVALKTTPMSQEDQELFADLSLRMRMRSCKTYIRGEHLTLLKSNRPEDDGVSTWEIFQRVQDNLGLNFRGNPRDISYTYLDKDENGVDEEKTRKVRETMSIKAVTEMNRELFDLIEWFMNGKPAK